MEKKINELVNPKKFCYSLVVKLILSICSIFLVISIFSTFINHPINYWLHLWFFFPLSIVTFSVFYVLVILTKCIIITNNFIEIKNIFFSDKIFYQDIRDVILPLTERNKSKSYIFIMNSGKKKRISISIYFEKPIELYYYINLILKNIQENNKKNENKDKI